MNSTFKFIFLNYEFNFDIEFMFMNSTFMNSGFFLKFWGLIVFWDYLMIGGFFSLFFNTFVLYNSFYIYLSHFLQNPCYFISTLYHQFQILYINPIKPKKTFFFLFSIFSTQPILFIHFHHKLLPFSFLFIPFPLIQFIYSFSVQFLKLFPLHPVLPSYTHFLLISTHSFLPFSLHHPPLPLNFSSSYHFY